jgi:hypothetical protein
MAQSKLERFWTWHCTSEIPAFSIGRGRRVMNSMSPWAKDGGEIFSQKTKISWACGLKL